LGLGNSAAVLPQQSFPPKLIRLPFFSESGIPPRSLMQTQVVEQEISPLVRTKNRFAIQSARHCARAARNGGSRYHRESLGVKYRK
jgi:hypothetical protein